MPGTHARAPGLGGWLRLGAQALHCTRSGRAETHRRVPSCGVQGMLRGPCGTESGRSGGLGESQGKTSRSMSLPRPCGFSLLISCAPSTLVQPKPLCSGCLLTLGPSASHPAFPAQPWSAPLPKELSHRVTLLAGRGKGKVAPRTWEGRSRSDCASVCLGVEAA